LSPDFIFRLSLKHACDKLAQHSVNAIIISLTTSLYISFPLLSMLLVIKHIY